MPIEWRKRLKLDDGKIVDVATRSAIASIRLRTRQGIDERGRAFKPYSPEYAERRQKAGLGTKPDLHVTGAMLGSLRMLRWRRTGRGVEIEIGPDAAQGRAPPKAIGGSGAPNNLKAMWVSRLRRFLGLRREDLDRMRDEILRRGLWR